ncbi:MAG: TIGR01212 family radical SAM protein [Bacteroidales bacterium]|nr:TIGR01212 family radical SAM protein [Bacteroidales bacterium]
MEFNSFVDYFRQKYGARLQKVVVDAGFTCPNRDGSKGTGGCSFCDNNAFHPNYCTPDKPLFQQIEEGIEFHKVRYRHAQRYIAYFQPYSNTYAPLKRLKELYEKALSHPDIEGIVVGTRPDCVDEQKLDYLAELSEKHIVIIEYGIESCYDKTLERIGRGHNFECAKRAVEQTAERGLTQCAHFIFGLPGETLKMMEDEAGIISSLPLTAVKFHQLQIIKGTRMEKEYQLHPDDFHYFTLDEYLDFISAFIRRLPPRLYIDRFASEVPPRYLSPLQKSWGLIRYQELLSMLRERMERVK